MNPLTSLLRGPMPLTAAERKIAKRLRLTGMGWPMIASAIGRSEDDVRHGLATIRTRHTIPARGTLNVSTEAKAQIESLQLPKEAVWETVNRLLGIS